MEFSKYQKKLVFDIARETVREMVANGDIILMPRAGGGPNEPPISAAAIEATVGAAMTGAFNFAATFVAAAVNKGLCPEPEGKKPVKPAEAAGA